ncbi:hypothetical protein ACFO3O_20925 [Dokdonia ponticola]|uniref:Uncharacterized protein n=1 Tax=Dokdonia ponticola TaxID=2041041 RepID=A0ABV9I2G4_9FLAO
MGVQCVVVKSRGIEFLGLNAVGLDLPSTPISWFLNGVLVFYAFAKADP